MIANPGSLRHSSGPACPVAFPAQLPAPRARCVRLTYCPSSVTLSQVQFPKNCCIAFKSWIVGRELRRPCACLRTSAARRQRGQGHRQASARGDRGLRHRRAMRSSKRLRRAVSGGDPVGTRPGLPRCWSTCGDGGGDRGREPGPLRSRPHGAARGPRYAEAKGMPPRRRSRHPHTSSRTPRLRSSCARSSALSLSSSDSCRQAGGARGASTRPLARRSRGVKPWQGAIDSTLGLFSRKHLRQLHEIRARLAMALTPLDLLASGRALAPACGRQLGDRSSYSRTQRQRPGPGARGPQSGCPR